VVAYLPQHLLATDGATVMEEASKAFGEILE
jgi:ATP-binding cassette subfamily F protein 3